MDTTRGGSSVVSMRASLGFVFDCTVPGSGLKIDPVEIRSPTSSRRPGPVADGFLIDAMRVRMVEVLQDLRFQPILYVCRGPLQSRHAVDDIDCQIEAVNLVDDGQLERSIDVAFF